MHERRLFVRVESEGFGVDDIAVQQLVGTEGISRLFDFSVVVVSGEPNALAPDDLLLRPATIVFEERGSGAPVELRRVHGIIAEVHDLLSPDAWSSYRLRIVPRLWLSTLVETLDMVVDHSVPDIVRQKLTSLDLHEGKDFSLALTSDYPSREMVVQYRETDLAFLSRLTEHLGIAHSFDHRGDRDFVVFSDHNAAFAVAEEPVRFAAHGERHGVRRIEAASRVIPRVYVERDYNYRNPSVDLTAHAELSGTASGGVIEYGAHFKDAEEGRRIAQVRAEERNAERCVFEAESDVPTLTAGSVIRLTDHPRGDMRLLITEVTHRLQQSAFHLKGEPGAPDRYENQLRAIRETTPYRPARRTPRPRVSGVLTAVVDSAQKGQYAELDDQGRYRVKFLFDTSDATDGKASRLVRMMQPHAGPGYGMRTGGGNEIAIDDAKDSHRIKMSTPTSSTTFQLGAPNDPERGAMLSTLGASTTVATTGMSAAGAFHAAISLITDYSSSGDITTIAKKPGPEAAFTLVVNVIDALVNAVTVTISEPHALGAGSGAGGLS